MVCKNQKIDQKSPLVHFVIVFCRNLFIKITSFGRTSELYKSCVDKMMNSYAGLILPEISLRYFGFNAPLISVLLGNDLLALFARALI